MKPAVHLAAIAALLCISGEAAAIDLPNDGDHALPCRPTIACTAEIVPPGAFEVEAGVLYRRLGSGDGQWTIPFLLKQTMTRALQIQVGSNGYTVADGSDSAHYFDDVIVGLKLHALDPTNVLPSLSFSAALSIPTARAEGYVRTYDALFTSYITKDLGPVHADLNLGIDVWRLDARPIAQEFAALALSVNLTRILGAMAETYAFSNAAPVSARDAGLLMALNQNARPWLVFDEGIDVGFEPSTRKYSLFVGMTIVPALLWRER